MAIIDLPINAIVVPVIARPVLVQVYAQNAILIIFCTDITVITGIIPVMTIIADIVPLIINVEFAKLDMSYLKDIAIKLYHITSKHVILILGTLSINNFNNSLIKILFLW